MRLYDILSLTRGRRCSGLIKYGILYVYSVTTVQGDNATALAEFALSECSYQLFYRSSSL